MTDNNDKNDTRRRPDDQESKIIYVVNDKIITKFEVTRISISMENQHPLSFRQVQGLTSILFYHL